MSFFDHFPGSSLDSRWTAVTGGSGSVSVSDSMAQCNRPAAADAAFIYHATKIDKSKSQIWFFSVKLTNNGSQIMSLVNRSTAPVVGDVSTVDPEVRVRVFGSTNNPMRLQFRYYNGSHTSTQWNGTTWATSGDAINAVGVDNFLLVGLEIDGPGSRFRLFAGGRRQTTVTPDQGYKLSSLTDWVDWSSLESTGDLWLTLGDPYNDVGSGSLDYEFVHFMDGDKVHAWSNGKDALSGNYSIFHLYGFEDSDDICRFFIMEDRTTTGIGIGGKDPFVVFDGTTYHMFFGDTSGNIGRATASAIDGTWTEQADVISKGTNEGLGFPFVVLDLDEADSNKRWKMLYSVSDISASPPTTTIKYATAPNASGTWTVQGTAIGLGSSGADDEIGATGAVAVWWNSQWEVWYTGMKPVPGDSSRFSILSGLRATGTDLGSLTKDGSSARIPPIDSVELVTANMNPSRTAQVSSTAGFSVDQPVYVDNDATADNWAASRVRKINTDSSLELYHLVASYTAASNPKIFGAGNGNIQLREIVQKPGGGWAFYVTQFGATVFENQASYLMFREETNLLEHSGANPTSNTPAWNWQAGIICLRGEWGQRRSNENMCLLHVAHQVAGGVEEADGSATGAGTVTGTSGATAQVEGSVSGVATVGASSVAFVQADSQASAQATGAAESQTIGAALAQATGQATAASDGQSTATTTASAAGVATADAPSQPTAGVVAAASGAATATGEGQSTAGAETLATGQASVTGAASGINQSEANASGAATAQADANAISQSDSAATGQATATATAQAIAQTVAQSTGEATTAGEGENAAGGLTEAEASATGAATVTGVSGATAQVAGSTAGAATSAGVGVSVAQANGTASGAATTQADSLSFAQTVASSAATSTATADGEDAAGGITEIDAQASGAATVIAQSGATAGVIGASDGVAASAVIAAAFTQTEGQSIGQAVAQSSGVIVLAGVGASAGLAAPLSVACSFNLTTGAVTGLAACLADSGATAAAVFDSTGTGTATGEGEDISGGVVAMAAGSATVIGIGDFTIILPAARTTTVQASNRTANVPAAPRTTTVSTDERTTLVN